MTPCDKCGILAATDMHPSGLTLFCAVCLPGKDVCQVNQHEWHGTKQAGTWICWRCPAHMTSQTISTAPVQADIPPTYDVYC